LLKKIKIITLTEFQKKYLIDLGMNTTNINTLINPISISEGVVKEFDFNIKKNNYLIYAGLVSEEKGVDSLISTYNLLGNFEKTLVIAGDGPLLEKLKYKYKDNEKIIFTGKITNFEVLSLIKNSYTTITNTSLYEGQPTLLSEASKLQINSIYPSSGGIQEFFPKDNPFAFKANNEIELLKKLKLLRHEEIVKDQAKSNKKFIEEKLKESNYISKFREIVE
jgi:glycosyltransferase involved in cell wall biosynthesis